MHTPHPLTDPFVPAVPGPTRASTLARAARRMGALDVVLGILFGVALFALAQVLFPVDAPATAHRAQPPAQVAAQGR